VSIPHLVVCSAAAACLLTACAGVAVHRVDPADTKADGVPFYLQRPYIAVLEEFPIEGEQGYVLARYDAATKTVTLGDVGPLAARLGAGEQRFPLAALFVPRADASAPGAPHSGEEPKGPPQSGAAESKEELAIRAQGIAKWDPAVPNDLAISDKFKVVFLPDLEEKYVIDANAGTGSADLSVATGPGGVLNQFQIQVDNSEIGKLLTETARTAVGLAKKAAEFQIGKLHSVSADDIPAGTTTLALRYTYVGHATPGLYPMLKKSEYPTGARGAIQDAYLIPAEWPYTRFAFKVRRTLLLEAIDLAPRGRQPIVGAPSGDRSAIERRVADVFAGKTVPVAFAGRSVEATFSKASLSNDGRTVTLLFASGEFTAFNALEPSAQEAALVPALATLRDEIARAARDVQEVANATFTLRLIPGN
jgi:hypothetical protein